MPPTATRTIVPSNAPTSTLAPGAAVVATADGMTLAFVPAGPFRMGSPDDDPQAFGNEKPDHVVDVPAFWIDRTEVTNAQYQMCVAASACTPPIGVDSATRKNYYADPQFVDFPVILVSWRQARAYCEWAGRRLPSESEWEKAARGTDGRLYPWGDQPPDNTLLNFNLAALDTTRVGAFPNGASPYGALDMAGNVVEWVDGFYYDSYFVFVRNTVTPTPAFLGGVRILRSSSWHDLFANIRVASRRYAVSETSAYNDVGFRCALDTP
jgi:serine/threonine-protein kinase